MKLPLSVFIIAQNEVDRISKAILSVIDWVDEVIVIDSGSQDGTQALAEKLGARVIFNAWSGYGAQKRFGESQCRQDWLLNLDADEEVTPSLRQEIQALFQPLPLKDGYVIGMFDSFPGEVSQAPLTYIKYFLRLYNKQKGSFSTSPVHDTVEMRGQTQKLKNFIRHYSLRSLHHYIEKQNDYTSAFVKDKIHRGKSPSLFRCIVDFFASFIKAYLLRRFIFRGKLGFIYAVTYAFGRFTRSAKHIEAEILESQNHAN